MKKISKISLIVISFILLLASCGESGPADAPEGMTLCENEYVDYYFYYPSEWRVDRNDGMISVYAESDRSNVSVSAFQMPSDVSDFSVYLDEEYIKYFESNFPDMEMISQTDITLDGAPGREYVFTCNIAGADYKFKQTVATRYDYIYVITYTAQASVYEENLDKAAKMVAEFKFAD